MEIAIPENKSKQLHREEGTVARAQFNEFDQTEHLLHPSMIMGSLSPARALVDRVLRFFREIAHSTVQMDNVRAGPRSRLE